MQVINPKFPHISQLRGKLQAENVSAKPTDKELKRILQPCVGGNYLIQLAKQLKHIGMLHTK